MRQCIAGKRQGKRASESGFSLLEVIIVVAIIMVLTALSINSMTSAIRSYRLSSAAGEIKGAVQVARIKATGRNTRYRVATAARAYRIERCDRDTDPCTWKPDFELRGSEKVAVGDSIILPVGVNFDITGITAPPPGQGSTVAQAIEMAFNSRGLLINSSTDPPAVINSSCFYVQGNTGRPLAVCTTLAGKTTVYRLFNNVWERQ